MADATVSNGELSDIKAVEIAEDEVSLKTSGLNQKIYDLEVEYDKNAEENEGYRKRIEELTASTEELNNQKSELKKQFDKAESENKALGSVAARAAELEGEVSRLQHDLASVECDLHETNVELSESKKDLEGAKEKDKEKNAKLEAFGKERGLLLTEFGKLEGIVSSLSEELSGKEREKMNLKASIEELEVAMENVKVLKKLKNELEKTIEEMNGQISVLQSTLEEKEKVVGGSEVKEIGVADGDKCGNKGPGGGLRGNDRLVVWGTTVAAIAMTGVACFVRAARKQ